MRIGVLEGWMNRKRVWSLRLTGAGLLLAGLGLLLALAGGGLPSVPAGEIPLTQPPRYLRSLYGPADHLLIRPMAILEGRDGRLFVGDGGRREVLLLDDRGRLLDVWTAPEMEYPVGLAQGENGDLFVGDVQAGKIFRFRSDGTFEGTLGDGVVQRPAGLFLREGTLWVADVGRHQILALDPEGGSLQRVYGEGPGEGPGQLLYPNYVWVDEDGTVYVADSNNHRIQVFEPEGELRQVLGAGTGEGRLLLPRGLGIDPLGRLHVVSTLAHQVVVLDPSTDRVLATYGLQGSRDGELLFPNGLWTARDRVYVVDRGNARIQIWEYGR